MPKSRMFRPRYSNEAMQKLGKVIEAMVKYHNKITSIKISTQPEAYESLFEKYPDLAAMRDCIKEIENVFIKGGIDI